MNGTPETTPLTMRVQNALKKRLENLARSTGRSRSFLASEALAVYLDANEWQVAGIKAALSSLDRGKGIPHKRVSDWVASWETTKERPSPRGV
jgi:RHH-type transcriptional regulator, rel operon repressor / antitoxin RelB